MSKFYEVDESTKELFMGIFNKKNFPISIGFQFIGVEDQKNLISISKINDKFSFLLEKEILITINESLIDSFDDESVSILVEQEIDRISIDMNSGKIKLIKPNVVTFSSILNKYGVEKVSRALQIEELHNDQVKDKEFI